MRFKVPGRATCAAGLLFVASVAAGQPAPPPPGPSTNAVSAFAVRADPRLAAKVNAVLARLAQDVETSLPKGITPEAFVDRLCGGRRPARVEAVTSRDGSSQRVRFSPCVLIRKNVILEVDTNNTLEGFAVRNGLTPQAVNSMTITPGPNSSPGRVPTPTTLLPKDRVLIPEISLWTSIRTEAALVPDRAALVGALAVEIGCAGEGPEACLAKRGVALLERGPVDASSQPSPREPPRDEALLIGRERPDAESSARSVPSLGRTFPRASVAAVAPAAAPPPPPPPVAAAATPPFVDAIPVAPDQWPYDAKLLAAILRKAAAGSGFRPDPVVIGVAEGALAGADGAPLSQDMFASGREDSPEPDEDDDDGNGYLNDLLGAGPIRRAESTGSPYRGTGDVGLCLAGPPPFASWRPASVELASHGSIVATIAAGRRIRVADASVAAKLPKVTFFRMLDNVCVDDATFGGTVEPGDLALAFDYLENRSQIVNISYSVRPDAAKQLVASMLQNLMSSNKLLVVPAGNDFPGNLDLHRDFCPACLGNPDLDTTMVKRTVVVGAASRHLRRPSFSNFGPRTVWIYAPGEASDALDVRGQDATPVPAATSYAAPYASLAAALMWSLGIDDVKRVKERLDVATWPLFQADGRSDPAQGGVLDLVKAAAVRESAIDVRVLAEDGTFVRRTYVGSFVDELSKLDLCAGKKFFRAQTQALRFETSLFNDRQVRVYPRDLSDDTQHKWKAGETCRIPDGTPTIRLRTLDGEEKTFNVADVLQIQLPWNTGS